MLYAVFTRRPICRRWRATRNGFTYLSVIFLLALLSLSLAIVGQAWSLAKRREQEKQLLFVGHQFRRAIQLYYERTPGPVKQYPKNLEVLLADTRYAGMQRYLRKIYPDPVSGKKEWGFVPGPGGTIMGVYSLSALEPLKNSNFSVVDQGFENKKSYSDWKFVYLMPALRLPAR
jgi:type II secretory pathway pseudopilin PulG